MKNGGGQFTPKLGGHFELELGGHFKLKLGGQYHWNLQNSFLSSFSCCEKLFFNVWCNTALNAL